MIFVIQILRNCTENVGCLCTVKYAEEKTFFFRSNLKFLFVILFGRTCVFSLRWTLLRFSIFSNLMRKHLKLMLVSLHFTSSQLSTPSHTIIGYWFPHDRTNTPMVTIFTATECRTGTVSCKQNKSGIPVEKLFYLNK